MRVVIVGNSGAGKSTLAAALAQRHALAHLDLDTLAWTPAGADGRPQRRPLHDSAREIADFVAAHPDWVLEGCYADLVKLVLPQAPWLVFLNPGSEACVSHCRARPWEPHKYSSPSAQQRNLAMLIDWVRAYDTRDDEFSLRRHRRLFEDYRGAKLECTDAAAAQALGRRGLSDS